jgi:hypothetical protein
VVLTSKIDQQQYRVLNKTNARKAVDRLALTMFHLRQVVDFLKTKRKDWPDRAPMIDRLAQRFPPNHVGEGFGEENYVTSKRDRLVICLRYEDDVFKSLKKVHKVALHELAHMATESVGHTDEFYDNFKFIVFVSRFIKDNDEKK